MDNHQTAETRLASAVARVGEVFAGETAAPGERGCGRCCAPEEIAALRDHEAPLSDELVWLVAREVPSHWDAQAAVARRILPRLVELIAAGGSVDRTEGRMLRAAGWRSWPPAQAEAVGEFLLAYWEFALDRPHGTYWAFEFCSAAEGGLADRRTRLDAWAAVLGTEELASLVETWVYQLLRGDDEELRSWILNCATPRLRADKSTDPELLHLLSQLALPPELRWE